MRIALLLLLVAPLTGLAAPIEKPSCIYRLINGEPIPNELSPTSYRRWRHHGHLAFRLARVQSCSGRINISNPPANTNMRTELVHNRRAIPWDG